ncbi:MAG: SDR family oxidoreductase [Chloroflexi bacterium]|nr:SDR family oxidoreductase [Chloroflexota bacterium]
MNSLKLDGRVAIITHAASEMGRGICMALGRYGAILALGDTQPGAADQLAQHLAATGITARGWHTPGDGIKGSEDIVGWAIAAYGRLDIMVNMPVIPAGGAAATLAPHDFMQTISANLSAVMFGSQFAAQQMKNQGAGCIINLTSVAGVVALPGHAAFSSAIAGIHAITKVLATEWAPHGIRVVGLGAGLTPDLLAGVIDIPGSHRRIPAQYLVDASSIGAAVAYLASDDARAISGTITYIDGGWLADGYWE